MYTHSLPPAPSTSYATSQQKGGEGPSKGFNVLELTGALIPQGALVKGVKTGWRLAWTTLMKELAPQSKDGDYVSPRVCMRSHACPREAACQHALPSRDASCTVDRTRHRYLMNNAETPKSNTL